MGFQVTACLNTTWQHYANSSTWINFWKHMLTTQLESYNKTGNIRVSIA